MAIDLFPFAGHPVAVLGLGISGMPTAAALVRSGAEVWAWDDNPDRRAAAAAAGIPIVDLGEADLRDTSTLVLSPGIPHTHPAPHPIAARARAAGCEIIGDIELLARAQRDAGYIGITGTNGKSTTTALIGHIMSTAGREVDVGGNLGAPALTLAPLADGHFYILEMSSYQIDLTVSITFDIAVLLNISADHLDRHGGLDGYIAAKKMIFHRQTRPRTAVIGVDDPHCRAIHDALVAADRQVVVPVSAGHRVPGGVHVRDDGWLIDDIDGRAAAVIDLNRVAALPGRHNWQNAAAAYATCRAARMQPAVIAACMNSFPGLAHRQELVAVVDGIRFVNDSKATNADAAARALACYAPVYWIAGGRMKAGGIAGLTPQFQRIRHAFLIGECAETFAGQLAGTVPVTRCDTLDAAVPAAFAAARADGIEHATVLLSPAAASWDQFTGFEARGDRFTALVDALPGSHGDLADTGPANPGSANPGPANPGSANPGSANTDPGRRP